MQGPDTLVATAAYLPEPTAAAAARRFVRDTLQTWLLSGAAADGHGLVDDAVLLTSELVTNAVVHARTPFEVTCRLTAAGVEVVVSDGYPARMVHEPPAPEPVLAERTSGRGLLLPAALASAWGVTYDRVAKAVWFRIGHPIALDTRDVSGPPSADGVAGPALGGAGPSQPNGATLTGHGAAGLGVLQQADSDYGELLASTAESARAAVGADASYALMADEDGDLRLCAVAGELPGMPARPSPAALRAAAGTAGSVVTAAFVVDNRVIGLLAAVAAAVRRFTDEHAATLQQLADRFGPQLERARMAGLERVRRDRIAALAQARGLLEGTRDRDAVLALAGAAAVPRLVPWCAVLLPDTSVRAGLRTAYVRHCDEDRSGALAWLLDKACEWAAGSRPPGNGQPWRWPLGAGGLAQAPPRAAELAEDLVWCFPLGLNSQGGLEDPADRGTGTGWFAVGQPRDQRLPKEVAELAADLACRVGLALGNAPLISR